MIFTLTTLNNLKLKILNSLFFCTILMGCATPQAVKLYTASYENPIETKYIDIGEALPATYFNFKNGNDKKNIVFFFSGSGCFSHKTYLKPYLLHLKDASVFALQKQGVENRDIGFICSNDFQINDNLDVWLTRQKAFITRVLQNENEDTNVVLMGVSEGATIAGSLINSNVKFTHLVLISPLGKKMPDFLIEFGPNLGIFTKSEIEKKVIEINNDPLSSNQYFAGKTFKYWSSFSKYDPQDVLLNLKKPTIIGMGELDMNTPVEPVKAIFDAKVLSGEHNLSLIIYPKATHTLVDDKGNSNREQFLEEVNNFLTKTSNN